ncbi:hypothetical protein F4554_000916 [Actinopolymorpha rutila]|uniref:Uncharacterized protein n=1 Tax=Actinopolymorpha rutila TaxID=446787 RepID=A0A852Z983_9ACTN|nr:hypothetical protein [Actinopolymorpha rutila]
MTVHRLSRTEARRVAVRAQRLLVRWLKVDPVLPG